MTQGDVTLKVEKNNKNWYWLQKYKKKQEIKIRKTTFFWTEVNKDKETHHSLLDLEAAEKLLQVSFSECLEKKTVPSSYAQAHFTHSKTANFFPWHTLQRVSLLNFSWGK